MTQIAFPELRPAFEPTRATLHAYAHAVGAVPRAHAEPDPRWWHASLKPVPQGLGAEPVTLPDGRELRISIDFESHQVIAASPGSEDRFDMAAGMTGTEMGESLIAVAARLGLADAYDRDRFTNDEGRSYDSIAAAAYRDALAAADSILSEHRSLLPGPTGPVQVWPHGFDIAFEWFGRTVEGADGEKGQAQINFGFYPAGDPYFYSSPWPFDPALTGTSLPHGAAWNTDWNGAALPYSAVQGRPGGEAHVAEFFAEVHGAASPALA